ncbi:MAG: SEL1-like repeat protein, partial [Alphaproteobacteria bacterium]|nr:SEL1-like repeat protein [Alphaproteobacteria bacterium]
ARAVAARDGVHALTMRSVAAEAGIARPELNAHFASKAELLLAAAAEDLNGAAKAMRGTGLVDRRSVIPADDLVGVFSELAGVAPQAVEPPPAQVSASSLTADLPPAGNAPDTARLNMPITEKKRRDAAQLDEIVDRLVVPSGRLEGTAAAISRLERRMGVFERALAEMESRCEVVERAGDAAREAAAESSAGAVARVETLDKRLVQAIAEMRAELRDVALKLPPPAPAVAPPSPAPEAAPVAENPPTDHIPLSAAPLSASVPSLPRRQRPSGWRNKSYPIPRRHLFAVGAAAILVILATFAIALGEHLFSAEPTVISLASANTLTPARPSAKVPQDRLSALAEGGNAKAELITGLKYLNGDGYAKDAASAARWLERAADNGEPIAHYRLGVLYHRGQGVAKDIPRALDWYRAAAAQGNRKAMHNLGVAYAQAQGVPRDFAQAAHWFGLAANLDYVDSQFNLAVLYERGQGVPQSLTEAYKWYAIAAANNDHGSLARLAVLKTQMSATELAAARRAVAAFHPVPMNAVANLSPESRSDG